MASSKRSIRLKEFVAGMDTEYAPKPSYRERTDGSLAQGPFRVRTDRDGFLVTGNPLVEGPPVVFTGGSFVESVYSDEEKRFVSQVERALHSEGYGYRCLNGGYSGATTLQSINVLLNKLVPLLRGRGTLVFFVSQSDAYVVDIRGGYWNEPRTYAPIVPAEKGGVRTGGIDLEATISLLGVVVKICEEFDIELLLAISPFRDVPFEEDPLRSPGTEERFEATIRKRRELARVVREFGEERGVDVFDAASLLGGRSKYFYDDMHLNHEGQARFSELLLQKLQSRLEPRPVKIIRKPEEEVETAAATHPTETVRAEKAEPAVKADPPTRTGRASRSKAVRLVKRVKRFLRPS